MKIETKLQSTGLKFAAVNKTASKLFRKVFLTEGCKPCKDALRNSSSGAYESIYSVTSKCPTAEQLHLFLFPETEPVCKLCTSNVKWSFETNRFREFCSFKCSMASEQTQSKRKETMNSIYGVDNAFASPTVQKQIRATLKETYGVDNPSKCAEIQDKKTATHLRKRGCTHHMKSTEFKKEYTKIMKQHYGGVLPMQTEEVKQKVRDTMMERFGVEYGMQNAIIKERQRKTTLKNNGVDNIFKDTAYLKKCYTAALGVDHPMRSRKVRAGMRKRSNETYGVDYPMQDPDVMKRQFDSSKQKKLVTVLGTQMYVRGFEDFVINRIEPLLKYITIDAKEIPRVMYKYKGKQHYYFPDMLVHTRKGKSVIEVKSIYTLESYKKNSPKFRAATKLCNELGYAFWVAVAIPNKQIVVWCKNPTSIRQVVSEYKRVMQKA